MKTNEKTNEKTNDRRKGARPRTKERLEYIRRNLDKTDEEIGDVLGVHRSAVHQLRKRFKIAKVHGTIQRTKRIIEQVKGLKPGLSAEAAAAQLGIHAERFKHYAKKTGYEYASAIARKHFYWKQRFEKLPPLLTITAVAKELQVTYGHAALLCYRHKYKVKVRSRKHPARVPIRRWLKLPHHERWLAALKPVKPE